MVKWRRSYSDPQPVSYRGSNVLRDFIPTSNSSLLFPLSSSSLWWREEVSGEKKLVEGRGSYWREEEVTAVLV